MVYFHCPTPIPIPIIVPIPVVYMQKCSTGTDSYGDSYANHGHFASLFKKIDCCFHWSTTGLFSNSHHWPVIFPTLLINKFNLSGTYIGAKMGTAAIGIGIGIGLGSVETVLHIFIEPNFIGIGIGVTVGIKSRAVETHYYTSWTET